MKRLFKYVCILLMGLCLSACSTNHDEAIRKVVSGYFDALKEGDLQTALTYCDKSFDDEAGLTEFTNSLAKQLEELDLGESFNKEAYNFMKTMIKSTVQDYEILNYSVSGDTATVNVDVTGINAISLDLSNAQNEGVSELSTYIGEHTDDLNKILNDKGEDAMKQEIVDQASVIIFGKMNEVIEKAPTQTKTIQITLKYIDKEWKLASTKQ